MIANIFRSLGYEKHATINARFDAVIAKQNEQILSLEERLTTSPTTRIVKRFRIQKRSFNSASDDMSLGKWTVFQDNINELLSGFLDKIRNRSNEKAFNNSYARKIIKIIKNNVVGDSGIRLQCRFKNKNMLLSELNNLIENKFALWCEFKNCDISQKLSFIDIQNLIVSGLVRDGEAIIRIHKGKINKYGMALEVIEASLLDVTYNKRKEYQSNKIQCGIELDDYSRPVAYYFKTDSDIYNKQKLLRIEASEILHLFFSDKAGQLRGIPWLNTALKELHKLDGYIDAELTAARVCSAKMGFFLNNGKEPYTGDGKQENYIITDAAAGSFEELPAGMDFKSFDPQHPNSNFSSFLKVNLRGVAAAAGISYHSLSNDLENVNFSSIRAALLEERDEYKSTQNWLIEHFCIPVFREFLEMSIVRNIIPVNISEIENFYTPNWLPKRWAWVDPLKDVKANIEAINSKTKSRQEICAEQGRDFEDVILELAHEKILADQHGINLENIDNKANTNEVMNEAQ